MSNKVLILGAGAVTRECYLPALQMLGSLPGTLVVDPSERSLSAVEQFPGVAALKSDFASFAKQGSASRFDALIVALPNSLHEAAVIWALERGYPVLCEKPLALRGAVCERLGDLADRAGKLLAVNMVRRQYPSYKLARLLIAQGAIGRLTSVTMSHGGGGYTWPAASLAVFERDGGGLLADMGVHYLDLAETFLGPLTPLSYQDDWRGGVDADLQFDLRSAAGVSLTVALSRRRDLSNEVVFQGTDGRIAIGVNDFTGAFWTNQNGIASRLTATAADGSPATETTFVHCFAAQLRDFLASPSPIATARDAARTTQLLEWAYAERVKSFSEKRQARMPAPLKLERRPVCVTGGSGFIGGRLVERLAAMGFDDILVPVRRPATCSSVARFPVRLATVDLLDPAAVGPAVAGRSLVFHLAYGSDDQGRSITIDGTKCVVEAAIAAQCDAVVVLSSMAVFGHPNGETDESAPYRPAYGDYGRSKMRMEQWCLERSRTSGRTRIVVLNPSCVYGPAGPTYTELPATLAREGHFCWIDAGSGNANYVYVDNLVDAILLAAATPEAHGQRFLINDGMVSWRRFLEPLVEPWMSQLPSYSAAELKELAKRHAPKGSLLRAMRLAAADAGVREQLRTTPWAALARRWVPTRVVGASRTTPAAPASETTGVPPVWLVELFGPSGAIFVSKKAERILGWRSQVNLEEGQQQALAWLRWKGIQ